MTRWIARATTVALAVGVCLAASPARAQAPRTGVTSDTVEMNLNAYVDLMRSDIRAQKVAILTEVMGFTETEDTNFWPIYRDYEAKLGKINDDRLKLTIEYASGYDTITDADADRLIKGALDVQARRNALTAEYYDHLKAKLPAKTAARVIQVEHQILLLLDLQIAASLPIVE
jgi:hypothetical protein